MEEHGCGNQLELDRNRSLCPTQDPFHIWKRGIKPLTLQNYRKICDIIFTAWCFMPFIEYLLFKSDWAVSDRGPNWV